MEHTHLFTGAADFSPESERRLIFNDGETPSIIPDLTEDPFEGMDDATSEVVEEVAEVELSVTEESISTDPVGVEEELDDETEEPLNDLNPDISFAYRNISSYLSEDAYVSALDRVEFVNSQLDLSNSTMMQQIQRLHNDNGGNDEIHNNYKIIFDGERFKLETINIDEIAYMAKDIVSALESGTMGHAEQQTLMINEKIAYSLTGQGQAINSWLQDENILGEHGAYIVTFDGEKLAYEVSAEIQNLVDNLIFSLEGGIEGDIHMQILLLNGMIKEKNISEALLVETGILGVHGDYLVTFNGTEVEFKLNDEEPEPLPVVEPTPEPTPEPVDVPAVAPVPVDLPVEVPADIEPPVDLPVDVEPPADGEPGVEPPSVDEPTEEPPLEDEPTEEPSEDGEVSPELNAAIQRLLELIIEILEGFLQEESEEGELDEEEEEGEGEEEIEAGAGGTSEEVDVQRNSELRKLRKKRKGLRGKINNKQEAYDRVLASIEGSSRDKAARLHSKAARLQTKIGDLEDKLDRVNTRIRMLRNNIDEPRDRTEGNRQLSDALIANIDAMPDRPTTVAGLRDAMVSMLDNSSSIISRLGTADRSLIDNIVSIPPADLTADMINRFMPVSSFGIAGRVRNYVGGLFS